MTDGFTHPTGSKRSTSSLCNRLEIGRWGPQTRSLEIEQFHDSRSGRSCPPYVRVRVPVLYPCSAEVGHTPNRAVAGS